MLSFLPLETLPGWPEAPDVSTGFYLLLMVIAPLAVGVIATLIGFAPQLARGSRSKEISSTDDAS